MTGSPAHAGIDLILMSSQPDNIGFPRTRGDRPFPLAMAASAGMVPPHTRG